MGQESNNSLKKSIPNEISLIPNLNIFCYQNGKNSSIPLIEHSHKEKFEFLIVKSGALDVKVDGDVYTLFDGEALVVLPSETHCINEVDTKTNVIWFQLDGNNLDNFLGLDKKYAKTILTLLARLKSRKILLEAETVSIFLNSFKILQSSSPIDKLNGYLQFINGLFNLLNSECDEHILSDEIRKAIAYIHSNITETIDINELLVVTKMDTKEFKDEFINQTGVLPREFINIEKTKAAAKEIQNTDTDIYDIIYDYGFASPRVFKVTFKKLFGISPEKFRKRYKK